MAKKKKK
ncbi:putative membrane protein, partial [Yersinia pestis PY-88]